MDDPEPDVASDLRAPFASGRPPNDLVELVRSTRNYYHPSEVVDPQWDFLLLGTGTIAWISLLFWAYRMSIVLISPQL